MTKHVKVKQDGAVELSTQVVSARGWVPGADLELVETREGILARPAQAATPETPGFDYEEFRRRVPKHEGPPATLEDMERAIDAAMRERWLRKEANSR